MVVVGKNVDPKTDGTGNAPISWVANELLNTSHMMNRTRVAWTNTSMRSYLIETIFPLIPSVVRNRILSVRKTSANGMDGPSHTDWSDETIWIPSYREAVADTGAELWTKGGATYPILQQNTGGIRKKHKANSTTNIFWWLRSWSNSSGDTYRCIQESGGYAVAICNRQEGVCIGFCT